jgi:predicted transcriptional regulator
MARPRKTLTDEQVAQVEKLAAVLTLEQIADFLGVSGQTVRRRMKEEPRVLEAFTRGRARAVGQVATNLVQQAVAGNTQAAIFYLKTQAGWKETNVQEHTGEGGGPLRFTVVEDYSGAGDGDEE